MTKLLLSFTKHNLAASYVRLKGREKWLTESYERIFKKKLDLQNPTFFSEKMQWLKLFDNSLVHTTFADKYFVREYVAKKIGAEYLVPLVAYFHKRDLSFAKIKTILHSEKNIVVKATHGSGWVKIYREHQEKHLWNDYLEFLTWMNINYYSISQEPQYKNLEKGIIIEKLLLDANGKLPIDYKFHCFNGKMEFIHLATDREGASGRIFYDRHWQQMNFQWSPRDKHGKFKKKTSPPVAKPQNLDEMIRLAEKLSEDFTYVRVDFYTLDKNIYFGELTFHPGSGFDCFEPLEYETIFGEKLAITPQYKK